MASSKVYQFKISLKGTRIWRRIQVPADFNFWDLHQAIQQSMGWMGHHMHRYTIVNPQTGATDRIGISDDDSRSFPVDSMWVSILGKNVTVDEQTADIAKYFKTPGAKGIYEYDFGDGWKHLVTLETILPEMAGDVYPKCTGGRRACPLDDCGGVGGYDELLKILADPTHEEHQERIEWVDFMMTKLSRGGETFLPEKFQPSSVKFFNF